tara:strand:- start:73 stop:624 length:552 start_codon:yes stop_codon:yes gene_type:complete
MINIKNKQIYLKFFKKNIYNLFFITVIITCILYIYSYNNIIEPQNKIDKTCEYIASTREHEYTSAANKKQDEIDSDLISTSLVKSATGSAINDGLLIKRIYKNGSGVIPSVMNDFVEENIDENKEATIEHDEHLDRNSQLEDNQDIKKRSKIWYDTYCNNINTTTKHWAGWTNDHLKKQAERI